MRPVWFFIFGVALMLSAGIRVLWLVITSPAGTTISLNLPALGFVVGLIIAAASSYIRLKQLKK